MKQDDYLNAFSLLNTISSGLDAYLRYTVKSNGFNTGEKENLLNSVLLQLPLLVRGTARIYLYHPDEQNEHTLIFWEKGSFMPPVNIFLNIEGRIPMIEYLEDSLILAIEAKHLRNLYQHFAEFAPMVTKISEQHFSQLMVIRRRLSEMSVEERYLSFEDEKRYLFNICESQHIASFLGMHPKTLSMLKGRNLKR
ncbi:Crp/Fnr family transcriptional regulator [Pedobacter sp.]|uniref:Crp/Fnr family transcriptional regulator n=1 Tax=Pedobacter sp. TaxID=1411316 RepID=UPI003BAB4768